MNRRPNLTVSVLIGAHALIVPVLIVASALIGVGGIATGLSTSGDPTTPVGVLIVLQENGTTVPATDVGNADATITAITGSTGAGTPGTGATASVPVLTVNMNVPSIATISGEG